MKSKFRFLNLFISVYVYKANFKKGKEQTTEVMCLEHLGMCVVVAWAR